MIFKLLHTEGPIVHGKITHLVIGKMLVKGASGNENSSFEFGP